MESYDPDTVPDPKTWLEMDEGERILLVADYHEQAGEELPDVQVHAVIHVSVENQLAEAYLPAVQALARLRRDGLGRHDAVHAIGAVLADHFWAQTQGDSAVAPGLAYEEALRTLTAQSWCDRYSNPD